MCLFPLSSLYLDDLKLYSKSEEDMATLVNTVSIFSDDIGMSFGFNKCANIAVKRGKVVDGADVSLPGGTIEALPMSASYKYLGVLESAEFRHIEVKSIVTTTYKHQL